MANTRSQMKRNRQNETARLRNKAVRSRVRTLTRRFDEAHAAGDREAADAAYQVVSRELDRAATKGVVHRNTAANRKSKMARRLNGM